MGTLLLEGSAEVREPGGNTGSNQEDDVVTRSEYGLSAGSREMLEVLVQIQ
jgi:hypothetical protein